jgi:hypothetical protein
MKLRVEEHYNWYIYIVQMLIQQLVARYVRKGGVCQKLLCNRQFYSKTTSQVSTKSYNSQFWKGPMMAKEGIHDPSE